VTAPALPRTSPTRPRPGRRSRLTRVTVSVAGLFAAMTALAPSAGAAAGDWNPGKHDEDVIQSCWTGQDAPGVSADVGWRSLNGEVPRVGEIFYVRAYAGLVGLPCSQGGAGTSNGSGTGTGTGGSQNGGGTPNGGTQPHAAVSATSLQLEAGRWAVKAVVTIASSTAPSGTVTNTDKGRTIATAPVTGRTVSIKLPRRKRGKHLLVATFSGGSGISGSASAPQEVRVR